MNKNLNHLTSWLLAGSLAIGTLFSSEASAQTRRSMSEGARVNSSRVAGRSASRESARPAREMTSGASRRTYNGGGSGRITGGRTNRHSEANLRPGDYVVRHDNSTVTTDSRVTYRPGGNTSGQGNSGHGYRPGGNNRPGQGNSGHGYRPGGNNRPGQGNPGHCYRPGGNHRPGYGHRPGSAPRPGSGGVFRPRPDYRPPRPYHYGWPASYFGYWRPLPPPPVRPYFYQPVYVTPTISSVLGLTFGSLIDYGINALVNAGYRIAGYQDNAIFLSNVGIMGYTWPQATVYYASSGGMNGALFQARSGSFRSSPYNKVYKQLCRAYGDPVETTSDGGDYHSATWWGGNDSGYITLTSDKTYDTGDVETNLVYGSQQ